MKVQIEFTERELKELIVEKLQSMLGDIPFEDSSLCILVKSKQNYSSEWEIADFKAKYIST